MPPASCTASSPRTSSCCGAGEARLAAFCTAKGRMLASFIGVRRATRRDPAGRAAATSWPPTLKRLSMFVLRAKAKLHRRHGRVRAVRPGRRRAARRDRRPGSPGHRREVGAAQLVRALPGRRPAARAVGRARRRTPRRPARRWRSTPGSGARCAAASPRSRRPSVEAFVPQMLNYESVGGVNFKKGCYPGQEVVARSQFRGTLKRRAYLVHCRRARCRPGQEVFHAADAEQPCGIVAQAAPAPGGGWDAIVSMQTVAPPRRAPACRQRRRAGARAAAPALPAARRRLISARRRAARQRRRHAAARSGGALPRRRRRRQRRRARRPAPWPRRAQRLEVEARRAAGSRRARWAGNSRSRRAIACSASARSPARQPSTNAALQQVGRRPRGLAQRPRARSRSASGSRPVRASRITSSDRTDGASGEMRRARSR